MMICVILYMDCPVWQILCNPAFVLQHKQTIINIISSESPSHTLITGQLTRVKLKAFLQSVSMVTRRQSHNHCMSFFHWAARLWGRARYGTALKLRVQCQAGWAGRLVSYRSCLEGISVSVCLAVNPDSGRKFIKKGNFLQLKIGLSCSYLVQGTK